MSAGVPLPIDHALALAGRGHRVFPLQLNGKTPAIDEWPALASSDPDRIRRFWTDPVSGEPEWWNIGVVTGDGLTVLDIDNKPGKPPGADALDFLLDLNGPLPDTYTVDTPNGTHFYLRLPDGVYAPNSASTLGPSLDVRGDGGFVVGAGSIVGGKEYRARVDVPIGPGPEWYVEKIRRDRPRPQTNWFAGELDSEAEIARAAAWLRDHAPLAIEGAGGDHTTFAVAARLGDHAISPEMTFDLMWEHWNPRCSPPWDAGGLQAKIDSAWKTRKSAVGSATAELDFDDVSAEVAALSPPKAPHTDVLSDTAWLTPKPYQRVDSSTIPPRDWIIDGLICRGYVAGLVSPGGVGKTTLTMLALAAVVTGRDDLMGMHVPRPRRAWLWVQEDDDEELQRRFEALCLHHRINPDHLLISDTPALFLNSGIERPLTLATRTAGGTLKRSPDVELIIQRIRDEGVEVFAFDPLSEFHDANENDNGEMRVVWGIAREIAKRSGCAVVVIAHTRKPPQASSAGYAGDMDSLRGAGAQIGSLRLGYTLYGMDQKDAKSLGISDNDRSLYLKLDDAKLNIKAKSEQSSWFKRVSVRLLNGESVGALERVTLRRPVSDAEDLLERVGSALHERAPTGGWCDSPQILRDIYPLFNSYPDAERKRLSGALSSIFRNESAFLTQVGKVEISKRSGRGGHRLRLIAEMESGHAIPL